MAFGLIQGLANIGRQQNANKALQDLLSQDPTYQRSQYAAQQLGTANQYLNGRMGGALSQEANIAKSQANTVAGASRGATDSSQLLAAGSNAQGNADNAYGQLGIQEAQNKYSLLDNLNKAYGAMIQQDENVNNDKVRRFGNTASITGQIQKNKTNALNGVFNGLNSDISQGLQIASMVANPIGGLAGGLGKTSAPTDNSMDEYNNMLGYRQPLGRQSTVMPN